MSAPQNLNQFAKLLDIIARLRSPEGCPWDREQTHTTLRENMLEECYEALEALDEGDSAKLCEELGDILLQVVLHSQIASEADEFQIADVISRLNTKLISRHPHIFGSQKVATSVEVLHNWEALKQGEREAGASILSSVPKQMPALVYSQEIQQRVARVGFDWKDIDGVIDKLVEEVRELKGAGNQQEKEREFGDLLFTLVNIARRMGVDSETVLRETNQRFSRRFIYMEDLCRQRGVNIGGLSFEAQNALWDEAKKAVGGKVD